MKNPLCPATAVLGGVALSFVIPTEAKRSGAQFSGPFLEMFFERA
jgi:hypothetical protein